MEKSKEEAALIQKAIEKCFTLYLTRAEIMITLQNQFGVNPEFSENLLNSVEQNNPSFFKVYYQRLRIKQQIQEFNQLSSLIIKNSNFSSSKSTSTTITNPSLNINLNTDFTSLPNYTISTATPSQSFNSQDTTLTPHISQDSVHSSTSSINTSTSSSIPAPTTSNSLFTNTGIPTNLSTTDNHEILQNLMAQLQQNNNDQFASLSNNTNANMLSLNSNTLDLNNINNSNINNIDNSNNTATTTTTTTTTIANSDINKSSKSETETTITNPNEFLIYNTNSPTLSSTNNSTSTNNNNDLPATLSSFMEQHHQQIPNLTVDFNFNFTQSSNKIPIPSLNQSCDFDSFLNLKQD